MFTDLTTASGAGSSSTNCFTVSNSLLISCDLINYDSSKKLILIASRRFHHAVNRFIQPFLLPRTSSSSLSGSSSSSSSSSSSATGGLCQLQLGLSIQ